VDIHKYYTQTTRILRACRCCNPFDRYCKKSNIFTAIFCSFEDIHVHCIHNNLFKCVTKSYEIIGWLSKPKERPVKTTYHTTVCWSLQVPLCTMIIIIFRYNTTYENHSTFYDSTPNNSYFYLENVPVVSQKFTLVSTVQLNIWSGFICFYYM